jgi:hypothetical protein
MGKHIISFALWGNDPKYCHGAVYNAEYAKVYFPEWTCRFYVDSNSVPVEILNKLNETSEIVEKGRGDWTGMFWRFAPASDPDVDIMLSRDCDSRLSRRERIAVDEWLESGKSVHIIRDHPQHGTLILGGLWGVRGDKLQDMQVLMNGWNQLDMWQTDQDFLRDRIYPLVHDDIFVHDEFYSYEPVEKRNIIKCYRDNYSFLGEQFNAQNEPNMAHRAEVKRWYDSRGL